MRAASFGKEQRTKNSLGFLFTSITNYKLPPNKDLPHSCKHQPVRIIVTKSKSNSNTERSDHLSEHNTTMKAFLFESIQLNNIAVESMMGGRYADAISSLIKAHLAAREGIRLIPEDYKVLRSSCGDPQEYSLLDHLMLLSDRSTPQGQESHVENQEFFIYNRPILIPLNLSPQHQESHAVILISILFNLALAQHLCALRLCPQAQNQERLEMTRQALKLYRLAFQLHHSHQQEDSAFGFISRPSNMLLLALMNNSGHTYHMLGDNEDSSKCFQHLFASLMWLRTTNWWQSRVASEECSPEKMFAGFTWSTATWLLGHLPEVSAPAA